MSNPQGEEFIIGTCPNQFGPSKERPNVRPAYTGQEPTPTWDDLLNLLAKEDINKMGILFCGKAGSDGKVGGTGWGIVNRQSVQKVALSHWEVGTVKLKSITTDPANTAPFAQELLGLNVMPIHITGIVVRKLN